MAVMIMRYHIPNKYDVNEVNIDETGAHEVSKEKIRRNTNNGNVL